MVFTKNIYFLQKMCLIKRLKTTETYEKIFWEAGNEMEVGSLYGLEI